MITPQEEFMRLVRDTAQNNSGIDVKISLKELDPKGGIYAELGSGFVNVQYYDKSAVRIMPVLFLCRNERQMNCVNQLSAICNYLQSLKQYPQGDAVSWLNAVTAKEPNKIGRDEDGMYNYSCIVNCTVYF